MGKFLRYFALLIVCTSLLTGCWDRRELEERASVLAIAIDQDEDDENLYKMTVQIPIPIKIAGSSGKGGGSGADAVKIMSVTGRTVTDAANNLQMRLNQRLFLGHTRILALSEEIARKGIQDIMDSFRREPQIRRLLWPIVVRGKASTLLEIKPRIEPIPVVFLMGLIENGMKLGRIPDQTLGDYFNQTSNLTMEPFLNYVEASKNEVSWKGVAVFRGHKMMGILDHLQTWALIQLRNEKPGGDIVIALPKTKNGYVSFRPHFAKKKVTIQDDFSATFHCELQGDIVELTEDLHIPPEQFVTQMQALIKKEMENRAKKLLQQLQKQYNSDILKLGLTLRAKHYHDYWKTHDWKKDFRDFPIRVKYTIKLRRLGMEMQ
ncbi:Ger(x)C family spore germination protein [Brevibacillus fortis]|uniref:Ger(X)C family spore germination protein n=1 Tax=Brevibacillus fortis TaxID=2126352 RepID=A0A2P7UKZ4_9BACL|nr:Ger(x)C family spore germination protein [Brevibacillus fortis]MED1780317.1 Ger(x)C family spore germination protein [Brevibacillus fortis]PSJ87664.1 Ger(x)C family spore germination protein [Brevibacillus fortis]